MAAPYRSTAEFDSLTVPTGLLRDHRIKAGTWGLLRVTAGAVLYEAGGACSERLTQGETWVIPPELVHHVALEHGARFIVEFYDHDPRD